MKARFAICLITAVAILTGSTAFAAGNASKTNTVSPTLVVNVTVQEVVRLTLPTGSQCTLPPGGAADYSVNFGKGDALSTNDLTCGAKTLKTSVSVAPTNDATLKGTSSATITYTLTAP
jgi:hypothetical protein